jgi:selenocysteine lyase/cysteine desulfurase
VGLFLRPLRALEQAHRITLDILPLGQDCDYDLEILDEWCRKNRYRLAVFNHVSNVTGTVAPFEQILPRLRHHGIISVIDGAQSAGHRPLNLAQLDPDVFCFTGHKGLFGPPGTGGIYLKNGIEPRPLRRGGTGSRSEEELQPDFLPDRYEAGTPNTLGLAGLQAGIEFIQGIGCDKISAHERALTTILRQGLEKIPGVKLHLPRTQEYDSTLLSFTIDGIDVGEIGFRLDREFGIMTRVGLHCAPRAHMSLGTFPQGTVRLAPGWFNRTENMETVIAAVATIAKR